MCVFDVCLCDYMFNCWMIHSLQKARTLDASGNEIPLRRVASWVARCQTYICHFLFSSDFFFFFFLHKRWNANVLYTHKIYMNEWWRQIFFFSYIHTHAYLFLYIFPFELAWNSTSIKFYILEKFMEFNFYMTLPWRLQKSLKYFYF